MSRTVYGRRARRAQRRWLVAVGVAVACVAAAAGAGAAELTKAERARLDLSLAATDEAALRGVIAPTPPATTTPFAAEEDADDSLCGLNVSSAALAERYEGGGLNGDHAEATNPDFSFVYVDTTVTLFPKVADGKRYMRDVAQASADCKSYYYGDRSDERYIPIRELEAPAAGDQSALLVTTLVFPSGNQRFDVFSFVRRGPLTSEVFLQLSQALDQPELERLAKSQEKRLDAVLASAKGKADKSS